MLHPCFYFGAVGLFIADRNVSFLPEKYGDPLKEILKIRPD